MEVSISINSDIRELRLLANALDFRIKQDIFVLGLMIRQGKDKVVMHDVAVRINEQKILLTKLREATKL